MRMLFDVEPGKRVMVLLGGFSIHTGGQRLAVDRQDTVTVTLTNDYTFIEGVERRRCVDVVPAVETGEIWLGNCECEAVVELPGRQSRPDFVDRRTRRM